MIGTVFIYGKIFLFYYDTISMHFLSYMKRANRMNKPVKLIQKRSSNNLKTHIEILSFVKL